MWDDNRIFLLVEVVIEEKWDFPIGGGRIEDKWDCPIGRGQCLGGLAHFPYRAIGSYGRV